MKTWAYSLLIFLATLSFFPGQTYAQTTNATASLADACDGLTNTRSISSCTDSLLGIDVDTLFTREDYFAWNQTATTLESALRFECQNTGSGCFELAMVQENNVEEKKKVEDAKEFANFRFGVGIAMTGLSSAAITDIKINEGIVSVNRSQKNSASLMLEAHQFLRVRPWGQSGKWGIGPFISVSITDEEGADPLSSYGAGLMFGWKQADSSTSWNVGIGAFVNSEVVSLRDGVVDGMATTATDPESLVRTSDESGWMLMFSSTW